MSDITYTIGARDRATPVLDNVGDSMSRLERRSKDLGEAGERGLKQIGIGLDSLLKASGILYAADKAIQAVQASFEFIAGGVQDFNAAEEAVRSLDQAMELNGGSSEELITQYTDLADAVEKATNVAAEDTLALMKQAAALGASNDQLGNMATAAVGLAEVLGTSTESAMEKVRLATEGNFKSFERLIPSIKNMQTDSEKLAAVMELSANGFAMVEAKSQTAGGQFGRLSTKIGDIAEAIGGALSPVVESATVGLVGIASTIADIVGPALESSGTAFGQWQEWIQQKVTDAANGIIAGLTMAEVIFNNFGTAVGLVRDAVALKVEGIRADVEHAFTVAMPEYIEWFGDNFFSLMETAWSAVSTVISNHISKITDMFGAFWDYLASGGGTDIVGELGEIAGRSYLEGFENSIGELPTVAARTITALEKELQGKTAAAGASLMMQFQERFNSRAIKAGENVASGIADGLELNLATKIEEATAKAAAAAAKVATKSSVGASAGVSQVLQATESRLLTRGPEDRNQQALIDESRRQTEIQRKTMEEQKKVVEATLRVSQTLLGMPTLKFDIVN